MFSKQLPNDSLKKSETNEALKEIEQVPLFRPRNSGSPPSSKTSSPVCVNIIELSQIGIPVGHFEHKGFIKSWFIFIF